MPVRSRRPALRRLALAAALVTVAAPAAGQLAASFPPSRALVDIAAWLQRDTPLQPAQVVDIGPAAVTAVTSAAPMGATRGFLANIASEALDPEIVNRDGVAAWTIPVEVDCERRQVRLGVMTGYRSRDLQSEPRVVRDADTAWVSPTPTAPLASVIRALCDRDFHRPLAARGKPAARPAEPARPAPPPLSTPPAATPAPAKPPAAPAPAAAKPKPKPPAGGGAFTVQVGASPSLSDAQNLLARVRKKFAAELGGATTSVATVQVGGKTVNRVLISGFASSAEANGFCKTLAAAGQACFVRR